MTPYQSTIRNGDLELGQDYFGSTVTAVDQNVTTDINADNIEIYVVKRSVSLKNGVVMKEEYHRERRLGEIQSKSIGLPKEKKSGRSKSRDPEKPRSGKSRDQSDKRKKRTPRKNRSMPAIAPKTKDRSEKPNRTKKKRSKSIDLVKPSPQPWVANFDDAAAKKKKDVGKIKLEEIWQEKMPEVAIVYPRNDAPDRQDDDRELIIAKGTWKFPDREGEGEPEGSDAWVPTYVQLDLDGSVNVCRTTDEDETEKPHGVWGLSPSDDANAANPSDLWFYPPDSEELDDGFQPIGKWKMMKESLWPPKSIGHVVDKRQFKQYKGSLNNVGKLKMPAFFSGK